MARPKRQPDSPETRDKILVAARTEFALSGLTAPLDAIAKRCAISRPSLLHHFRSKQVLIEALIDDVLNKARLRITNALAEGQGDYTHTMQTVMRALRALENDEQGTGSVLLHAMLTEDKHGFVTQRVSEFIQLIHSAAVLAGASQKHQPDEIKAVIAHLVMGEVTRIALRDRAELFWGSHDAVDPLYEAYFLPKNG